MTNSFQSTAATNIYDTPVSTFVNPVTVSPKTSLVALAETLQVVNPVLQTYLGRILEKEKQAAMRDVNKLRKTFANLDLDESALANPEDLQNRINRGSKRVLENLEKLTDPNQFDEESSNNN